MPFKCYSRSSQSQSHPSLDRVDFLLQTGEIGFTYFQTKIAQITLKVERSHWQWHNWIGYCLHNIETRQSIQIGLQDYYIPLIESDILLVVCSNPVGLSVLIVSFLYSTSNNGLTLNIYLYSSKKLIATKQIGKNKKTRQRTQYRKYSDIHAYIT